MLLFIVPLTYCYILQLYFNTSHVTVYPYGQVFANARGWFQYISCYCLSWWCNKSINDTEISIHLMLLFILFYYALPNRYCDISIHLMLLFIPTSVSSEMFGTSFQYISCYCLSAFVHHSTPLLVISIHLMLLFILLNAPVFLSRINFNTSHVTVYLERLVIPDEVYWFQYISCYCLSITIGDGATQYVYFNTSHVTVYPYA